MVFFHFKSLFRRNAKRAGRLRPVATLLVALAGIGIYAPAVATAASETHCNVFVNTDVQTCSTGAAAPVERFDARERGSVVIGRVFEDQDFRGSSLTIWGKHPCSNGNGRDFQVHLSKFGWENRISSVQAWANCWLQLYSGANYNGDHDGPFKNDTAYVGPRLDKRTKSIGFD